MQYSNFSCAWPVANATNIVAANCRIQSAAPTEPNSFRIPSVAASPWQWHRRKSSIAKGNGANSALPWPMPPTSLRCGRLPVAVASLQLSLCQAYRCLLRVHQKSMENPPWRVPGGAQASPEGSRCHFVVPGRLPERPGTLPKAPADAQEPPRGPHGTAHEPPRVARGGPRAPKWPKF